MYAQDEGVVNVKVVGLPTRVSMKDIFHVKRLLAVCGLGRFESLILGRADKAAESDKGCSVVCQSPS